ncbi:hypothetical protein [Streptomyces purpurogeneiscleroticus]|uniref:hypothetical protein n=1 Tax=Streptomyces purpurogeneiscleroticus TaxID=68259 RepID=UPI001CBD30E8|nr:hypothetical protein [Streptomyces purpurogeneiscleroticus]
MPRQQGSWTSQRELLAAAQRLLPQVLELAGYRAELKVDDGRPFFDALHVSGQSISVWVDAVPLPDGTVARTMVNTTSEHYMIHTSDRLPLDRLGRVLSQGAGEFLACRERSRDGLAPVAADLLGRGAELPADLSLSATDRGRIGELNWLAEQYARPSLEEEQRAQARAELSGLLDRCGLRPTVPVSETEGFAAAAQAAEIRLDYARQHLSAGSLRLVRDLAHPIEHLTPQDAAALRSFREAEAQAAREVRTVLGGRAVSVALPEADAPVSALGESAEQEAAARSARSAVTERQLRDEALWQGGRVRPRPVMIGGGAALTGRDEDMLLVDAVGRWHLDPGAGLVQSADQDRDLRRVGLDPYADSGPKDRVSILATRAWEDRLAARGPLVDGYGQLALDKNGRLVTRIEPLSGGEPLTVEVAGTPVIATGLTPEVVPGVARDDNGRGVRGVESLSEAVRLLGERVPELRERLHEAERSGDGAAAVLRMLDEEAVQGRLGDSKSVQGETVDGIRQTLAATQRWEDARAAAPGRALMGDEVADNRFDPRAAQHWIIAGSGGTGVANAEIILERNPDARVTILGGNAPAALNHQVQYREMTGEGSGYGDRLDIKRARLGAVETVPGPDGKPLFRVPFTDRDGNVTELVADGYVASLGRTNPLPPVTRELADRVREAGSQVEGTLLFDEHQQYLGYGLTFPVDGREHRVDVTGAASWQLPRQVFDQQTVGELNRMGVRQIPSESANAAPGFAPVAHQAAAFANARATDSVRRLPGVPERWVGPRPPAPETAAHVPAKSAPEAVPHAPAKSGAAAPVVAPPVWQTGVPAEPSKGPAATRPVQAPPTGPAPEPPRPDQGIGI